MARLWDISQPIRPGIPVWPGDTPYEAARSWTLGPGCPVNVSRITLSTHTGAHADAPFHYDGAGRTAEAVDLSRYLGPCRVIDARGATGLVQPADVAHALADLPPRVLLRTYARFPAEAWVSDFTALSPALVEALADRGVVLVGLDSPSVDPGAIEGSAGASCHPPPRSCDPGGVDAGRCAAGRLRVDCFAVAIGGP